MKVGDSSLEIFGAKIYLLFQYFCNQRVDYRDSIKSI